MAQLLRRPLLGTASTSSPLLRSSPSIQRRYATNKRAMTGQRPAQPGEPSYRIAQAQGQKLPSDLGLLKETFIPPTGLKRPPFYQSPFSSPFLHLQYLRARFRFRDFIVSLGAWYSSPKIKGFFDRTIKLRRKVIVPTAVALHKTMYTAFAEQDQRTLRKMCSDGIYDSFVARIASRNPREKWKWEVLKYNGRAKIISNRIAMMPLNGAALHQAVVRITSRQVLKRTVAGREFDVEPRDVVEYVVLQRRWWEWKESEWEVWGTTEETDWEEVKQGWSPKLRR